MTGPRPCSSRHDCQRKINGRNDAVRALTFGAHLTKHWLPGKHVAPVVSVVCAWSAVSDDTEMATVIAQVAASGADLRTSESLDRIADGFLAWFASGPSDVGNQTRHVLSHSTAGPGSASADRVGQFRLSRRGQLRLPRPLRTKV